jgi:TonB family protein
VRDLLWRRSARQPIPDEALAALADLTARVTAADDPSLVISLELSRREQPGAGAPRSIDDAIKAMTGWVVTASTDPYLRMLTAGEERALRARPESSLPPRSEWTDPATLRYHPGGVGPPTSVSRLVRPLTPGVLADILAISGCKARRDQVVAIDASYRPSGQVRNVSRPVGLGFDNEACNDAARLLVVLDIATGHAPVPASRTDMVLVGLRPDDLECTRSSTKRSGKAAVVGPTLQQPQKIRAVQPNYPEGLRLQRQQGIVVIDALISSEGCVAEAEVVQSAHLGFNAEALIAVSQWRYTPTILNGEAVPVIMTVTVNFVLR